MHMSICVAHRCIHTHPHTYIHTCRMHTCIRAHVQNTKLRDNVDVRERLRFHRAQKQQSKVSA